MTAPLRLATRASALAMWQANHVASLLRDAGGIACELVPVSTLGDRDKSQPLASLGGAGEAGQGVFTKEVQRAVLAGDADFAVHSLKDLPTTPTAGLVLAAVPGRGPTADVLVSPKGTAIASLADLSPGATVGTGSPRRAAQLRHHRADLRTTPIRGNVETRLSKLDAGEYDAIVLAEAGLVRLALADRVGVRLRPPIMWPAVSQAALGIECRTDDVATIATLRAIDDPSTHRRVNAERDLLQTLRAGCGAAVGVRSRLGERLHLEAVVLDLDGSHRLIAAGSGPDIGTQLGERLLDRGAADLITASSH